MADHRYCYFRLMDEYDLKWVIEVEKHSYAFPWSLNGFEKLMQDGLAYILCDQNHQRLGYACFLTVLDEVQLLNLCVAETARRQRVAEDALRAFQTHFSESKFRVMLLEVRESNFARSLYQKLGFSEDGVRKGYYPLKDRTEREDAVLMSWVFDPA